MKREQRRKAELIGAIAGMADLTAKFKALVEASGRFAAAHGSAEARALAEAALAYAAALDALPARARPAVLAAFKAAHRETKS